MKTWVVNINMRAHSIENPNGLAGTIMLYVVGLPQGDIKRSYDLLLCFHPMHLLQSWAGRPSLFHNLGRAIQTFQHRRKDRGYILLIIFWGNLIENGE